MTDPFLQHARVTWHCIPFNKTDRHKAIYKIPVDQGFYTSTRHLSWLGGAQSSANRNPQRRCGSASLERAASSVNLKIPPQSLGTSVQQHSSRPVVKPWKLASVRPGVCYVGLVYKQDHTDPTAGNACCGAQMFLDSDDGVVFRGAVGPWYSEKLKEYHLNKEKASELMSLVVEAYRDLHGMPPAELFIHGKTRFNDDEWEGFKSVVPNETNLVGVRIRSISELKLYRPGKMPVLRGTAYLSTRRRGYLWDQGFYYLDSTPILVGRCPILC